jgi:hypothetical protein
MTLHIVDTPGHVIVCSPVIILPMYTPLEVSWDHYRKFRGTNPITFLQWLFGWQVTVEEWQEATHEDYVKEKRCHVWQGVEYTYHE